MDSPEHYNLELGGSNVPPPSSSVGYTENVKKNLPKYIEARTGRTETQMELLGRPLEHTPPAGTHHEVVKYFIRKELPFSVAKSKHIKELMKPCFESKLSEFVGEITKSCISDELFYPKREALKSYFRNYDGKVCLSSTIWKNKDEFEYLCISAHFVDECSKLNRLIISFKPVEVPFTGLWLGEAITREIMEWGLSDKIMSVTLDISHNSDAAVNYVKNTLGPSLPSQGDFLHMRCCTRILNLMLQEVLLYIGDKIRRIVYSISVSARRLQLYKDACQRVNLKYQKLPLDVETRWHSTCTMLKVAMTYQKALDAYCLATNQDAPTDLDWENANFHSVVLKIFSDAEATFSGANSPAASVVVEQMAYVMCLVKKYSDNEHLKPITDQIKAIFRKYWGELPLLFGIAAILDPRCKAAKLEFMLDLIYGNHLQIEGIKTRLQQLFDAYRNDPIVLARALERFAPSKLPETSDIVDIYVEFKAFCFNKMVEEISSELQTYLDEPLIRPGDRYPFDVLLWWGSTTGWPVLSVLALDVLTVPVSAVASESDLSAGGHLIGETWGKFESEPLEELICLKDWILAEQRMQD